MNVQCPHCNTELEASSEHYGQTVACPSCTNAISIPAPEAKPVKIVQASNEPKSKSSEIENEILKGSPSWLYFLPGYLTGLFIIFMFSSISAAINETADQAGAGSGFGVFFFWLVILTIIILWKKNSHKFILTSRRIIVINGIIVKNEDEVRLRDIRSISLRRGLFNVFTGTASVKIATAATAGSEIVIRNISNAKKVQAKLNSLVHDMEK